MRAEKPTIHHWNCDLAEQLPVGVEEQPPISFLTTQPNIKEKLEPYVIHTGSQTFENLT
jgi:hypothetical protein